MELIGLALGLAKYAGPVVAKWLGGDKAESAAQDIVNIAEKITGRKGGDAEKAISADPVLALKFKQAIMDNQESLDKLYLEDRQDARKRDLELRKLAYQNPNFVYKNTRADVMLAVVGIALCLDIFLIAYYPDMKPEVLAIFNMMIGALLKMLGDGFAFEFGSSRGSKEKDLK